MVDLKSLLIVTQIIMVINSNQQKEKNMKNSINSMDINMKTIINTVIAIAVLTVSANSAARWHNAPKDGGSNHAHSMNMGDMDHSKMSASDHSMMDMKGMDHSKMSASELLKMNMEKMDHSNMSESELLKMNMKDMDHSKMDMKKADHSSTEDSHGH